MAPLGILTNFLSSTTRYSIQLISWLPRRDLQDHLAQQRYPHLARHWRAARWKWVRHRCFLGVTTLWIIGSNRHSRADCRYQQDVADESLSFPLSSSLVGEDRFQLVHTRGLFDLHRVYMMFHYVTRTLTVVRYIYIRRLSRGNGWSSPTLSVRENQIGNWTI